MRRLPILALMPFGLWAEPDAAGLAADEMWAALRNVPWNQRYSKSTACGTGAPTHYYVCSAHRGAVITETFYYPVDPDWPAIRLRRADFRLANPDLQLASDVEEILRKKLSRAYGNGSIPNPHWEIGSTHRNPGLSWKIGNRTIYLHQNGSYAAPIGKRLGLQLTLVDPTVFEQKYLIWDPLSFEKELSEALKSLYLPPVAHDPTNEAERVRVEAQTRQTLYRLLKQIDEGTQEERAAKLVAADDLITRLGALLVTRSQGPEVEASNVPSVRRELARYGVKLTNVGHYSGAVEQDFALLRRAWKEHPETTWGQRAFLLLQRGVCNGHSTLGCKNVNCFQTIIRSGEKFLEDYPESPFRKQILLHMAVANETWWSLSIAPKEDDIRAQANVNRADGERARQNAVLLYEQLMQLAPESKEAQLANWKIPRLKLKLDTGETMFFCGSC